MATAEPVYDPATVIASIGSGLSLSASGALTNDLITGKAGGQTITGGTGNGENLDLVSTSGTKGKTRIGGTDWVVDELNHRAGSGGNPSFDLDIQRTAAMTCVLRTNTGSNSFQLRSGAGADSAMLCEVAGGQDWTIGNKGSDGSFRLSRAAGLGSNDIFVVSSTSALQFTAASEGFFSATPVTQPNTTGTATGFTSGAGTAVKDDSTFTGGTGATAYRVSDIVKALKDLGLMAA